MGSRVPTPGCFTFFTAIWRAFHSTKSNDSNANFSFGIIAAVESMEPAQFFYVTSFNNTQASRDKRSCHFHAQICRCTDSAAPALSRASSRRLNDAFNISSLAHDNRLCLTPRHAHRCLLRHQIGTLDILHNCRVKHYVFLAEIHTFMISHVFQVTSHIVGLIALCTGK